MLALGEWHVLVFSIKYPKTRQGLVQGYVPVAVFSDTYCQIQVWAGTTPLSNDFCNSPLLLVYVLAQMYPQKDETGLS